MKGVILAGGTGSRLDPLTRITNKHLLPIYDRPMVLWAVEALVDAGVRELMLVTGGTHAGEFLRLLGNGHEWGIERLFYASAFEGGRVLDLLPPLSTTVERLDVELDEAPSSAESGKARAEVLKRKQALLLLESIGRRVHQPREATLHREQQTASLRALLESTVRSSVVLVGPEGAGKRAKSP